MAKCSVCDSKMGGFMGCEFPPNDVLERAKKHGIQKTDEICWACLAKMIKEMQEQNNDCDILRKKELHDALKKCFNSVRITTYPPSEKDDYEYCGLVTATAAIGTGPISQLVSEWTDFFGMESGTYNKKLLEGEQSCRAKIIKAALEIGANSIVGAQVTYTELTSGHGMILVCIAGTAVNNKALPQDVAEKYKKLLEEIQQLAG